MNTKRFCLASLATFIFIFAFDFVFHGILLKGLYEQTMHLWRPEDEYMKLMHWSLASQILFVVMFGWIFLKGYENKGPLEGIRYGVLIGLLFSSLYIGMYSYKPISLELVIAWVAGGIVELGLAGGIFALIYKPKI